MDIQPIRTAKEYARALAEVEKRFQDEALEPGTPTGDRFEVLLTLVEAYEREHEPIQDPDPIDAIQFHLDQGHVTQTDLDSVFGTRSRRHEIMNRRRSLTLEMIRELHERFDIPVASLIAKYKVAKYKPRKGRRTKPQRRRAA